MRYFEIGKIVNTQGLKGELRVIPITDDPTRFKLLKDIDIFTEVGVKKYTIEYVKYHKQFVILKLEGINSIEDGEKIKGSSIKVTEDNAIPLNENEYYISDLYDLEVIDINNNKIGVIKDIIFTGANDVYVVKTEDNKEVLIPAIKKCILEVNLDKKTVKINLLEGLM